MKSVLKQVSILYVEDEEKIRKYFSSMLKVLIKEVFIATDGLNALEIFKEHKDSINLIITDIKMPKLDGMELLKEIRDLDENIPYIITSAFFKPEDLHLSIKYNVSAYYKKPVDINKLIDKVDFLCQKEFDNTKLIKKEKELSDYLNILNKVAIISKTNLKGIITYANDIFCEVAKYKREELIGQAHNIIRHPDMPKSAFKDMWDTIESGSMWHGKVKNRAKDGSAYYVQASVFPLYENDDKKVIGYIAIRFLTTDEENEKRDFKKKVISNLSEIRKKESELKANNSLYKKEIVYLKNTITTLSNKSNKDNKNILSQNNQIKYYEEQQVTSNNKILNLLEKKKIELEHHIDSNKKLKNEKDELVKKNNKLTEYIETLEYDNKSLRENITDKNKKINDFSIIINDIGRNI